MTITSPETTVSYAQATPGEVAAFSPDRVARDGEGIFRPARIDPGNGLDVQYLKEDGTADIALQSPLVIMAMRRLDEPARTSCGLSFDWELTISTVNGNRVQLPDHLVRNHVETVAATVERLPGTGYDAAAYDVALLLPETLMQRVAHAFSDPFADVQCTLSEAYKPVTFNGERAFIWRATARRALGSAPHDFAALAQYPSLDDALARPFQTLSGLIAVPLLRREDGSLDCAVGSSHPRADVVTEQLTEVVLERLDPAVSNWQHLPGKAFALRAAAAARHQQAAESARADALRAREAHEEDMRILSDNLIEQAEERSWCSEYDDFVEQVNRRLTVELRPRKRDYRVEVQVTISIPVYVEAKDEDDASERVSNAEVREAVREHLASNYLESGDWEVNNVEVKD